MGVVNHCTWFVHEGTWHDTATDALWTFAYCRAHGRDVLFNSHIERLLVVYINKQWTNPDRNDVCLCAGHQERVWCAAWNHLGSLLATCSGDKTISSHYDNVRGLGPPISKYYYMYVHHNSPLLALSNPQPSWMWLGNCWDLVCVCEATHSMKCCLSLTRFPVQCYWECLTIIFWACSCLSLNFVYTSVCGVWRETTGSARPYLRMAIKRLSDQVCVCIVAIAYVHVTSTNQSYYSKI